MRKLLWAALPACLMISAPATWARQATPDPEVVVRRFYDWYPGRLNRDDLSPLRSRREALKYLTPQFRVAAPRISREQDVAIFICAQDRQAEWGRTLKVAPAVVRGGKATTRVAWEAGGIENRIILTLRKIGGAWKIDGALRFVMRAAGARRIVIAGPFDSEGRNAVALEPLTPLT